MAEPKYREIAADLESKIRTGQLAAGQRLPPDAELGQMYDASRTTVRQAIQFLLTRGVAEREPGGATLVRKNIDAFRTIVNAGTGFSGFEGAAYASDVQASNRRPAVTIPRVPDPGSVTGHRHGAGSRRRGRGGHPASRAVHRRRPVVDADELLPHDLRGTGRE